MTLLILMFDLWTLLVTIFLLMHPKVVLSMQPVSVLVLLPLTNGGAGTILD